MPPKVKITKEEIVKTAVELVRAGGEQVINARSVATALSCSTQPLFSNFATMDELRSAVISAAYDRYIRFIEKEIDGGQYPKYKAMGMAYIRFAKEEKELFKLLFMRDRSGEDTSPPLDFRLAEEAIMRANGVSQEKASLMHLEMWTSVHGIGVMMATSFLSLEWALIEDVLTDIYQGIRARHTSEEKKNGCN